MADDNTTDEKKVTEEKHEVTTKPADPTDDLVAPRHQLRIGRRTLDYTATTGRMVLREEVYEDGTFKAHKAKAEMSMTSYVVDADDPGSRPVTFAFNGGPGPLERVAAPRPARPAPRGDGRRRARCCRRRTRWPTTPSPCWR